MSLEEVDGAYQVQLTVLGNSAHVGDRPASDANREDPFHATIAGLDADGGQAGDSYLHSEERTSGDQKPGHPRVSAGKAFSALGPRGGDAAVRPVASWGLERAPNEGREKQIDHLGGSRASVVSLGGINDPGEANGLLPGVIQGHLVVALGSRCP